MTAVLVIAIWLAVGLVLGLLIGRGIATADRDAQASLDARELVDR